MIETVLHLLVLIGLAVSALLIYWFRDLLAAAIAAGLFSFLVSVEFYILQAPDVAIAQASIGAGLTTAIFIVTIRTVGREEGSP
ncbi:MAG: DUF4040 domain-containing protein [Methanomicrobiales archaeon]|nr:DUF4040 domain-containing protein [Methanomicrobiales archaeon]MDI6877188.1 DUF4040 domain-containing protein [Methanomicrobiales archaeon]